MDAKNGHVMIFAAPDLKLAVHAYASKLKVTLTRFVIVFIEGLKDYNSIGDTIVII